MLQSKTNHPPQRGAAREEKAMAAREENPWRILEETQPIRLYAKNQMIYLQEQTAVQFYYLLRGSVKIFLTSPGGAEHTLRVVPPGSLFGEASFFDGLPRVSSARTLEKSEIISVNRPALLQCIRLRPQLAMDLLHTLAGTIRLLSAQVDGMAFLRADQRLARLLLSLAGEDGAVHATHEELAGLAGVSRVTVSRLLSRMGKERLVESGYGFLRICDRRALALFAGEE